MNKLNTIQLKRLDELLNSFMVIDYHKTLLTAIKNDSINKNLSHTDIDLLIEISKNY